MSTNWFSKKEDNKTLKVSALNKNILLKNIVNTNEFPQSLK